MTPIEPARDAPWDHRAAWWLNGSIAWPRRAPQDQKRQGGGDGA